MYILKILCLVFVGSGLASGATGPCKQICSQAYSSAKAGEEDECQRGCRLADIGYMSKENPFFPISSFMAPSLQEIRGRCQKDCTDSYGKSDPARSEKTAACNSGCNYFEPNYQPAALFDDGFNLNFEMPQMPQFLRFDNVFNDMDRMFDDSSFSMPSFLKFGRPQIEVRTAKEDNQSNFELPLPSRSSLHDLLNSVQSSVKEMLDMATNTFRNDVKNQMIPENHGENTEAPPSGQLIVVKSGPNFESKKVYDIGPGDNIESIISKSMNDMMAHSNPLEQFFKNEDAEVIDPAVLDEPKENKKDEPAKVEETHKSGLLNVGMLGPVMFPFGLSEKEKSKEGSIYDAVLDGPRLPEPGLKSRQWFEAEFPRQLDNNNLDDKLNVRFADSTQLDVCSQDSKNIKWSDWISCLHTRLGLPKWLMAATICLGIVFAMWLCLVIPSSAPKQKVKKAKITIGTKELEASLNPHLSIISCDSKKYDLDLPPSYDDVTTMKVNLTPVHETVIKSPTANDEEAGPLPEKEPIEKV